MTLVTFEREGTRRIGVLGTVLYGIGYDGDRYACGIWYGMVACLWIRERGGGSRERGPGWRWVLDGSNPGAEDHDPVNTLVQCMVGSCRTGER